MLHNDMILIIYNFKIIGLLNDKEDPKVGRALFHRDFGLQSNHYTNRSFEPIFKATSEEIIPSNRSVDRNRAKELCADIYQCEYDYSVSLNRDLAHFTKNYLNTYMEIRSLNRKRIISCGVLETPRFGRKSTFLFVAGTKVAFECDQDFILIGDPRRTCLPNGRWDVPEYGYTECLRKYIIIL